MKRLILSKISTKLLCAVMAVLIITLGITSYFISNKVRQTFMDTVINDIAVSVKLMEDSIDTYTMTLSDQMTTQIDTMLSLFPGEFSIDYDNRIQTDGTYRAPTLKKGNVVLNDQLPAFLALTQKTGFAPTLFVYDKPQGSDEYDFLRTITALQVTDNGVYGKPLFIPADKRADALDGKVIYYTMVIYGSVKIGITYPITDKNGKLLGAITTSTDLDIALNEMQSVYSSMRIGGDSGYLYLLDGASGTFLVHPSLRGENSFDLADKDGRHFMKDIAAEKNGDTRYTMPTKDGKFDKRIAIFNTIPSLNWIAGASVKESDVAETSNQVTIVLLIAIVLTILIIMGVLRYTVGHIISSPLRKMSDIFKDMAQGDFSKNMESKAIDEIGAISGNLNTTLEKLNELFTMLKTEASTVHSSSEAVGEANSQMATGASRQAESANVMSAAVEELEYSIREMSDNVETTATEASHIKSTAEAGEEVLTQTVSKINDLSSSVIRSSENVDKLAKSIEQIANVLNVINDIADQTNLLALNAAIEAARAGEAGRGFAVVADEVRKLAEKTVDSTKEITSMISNIHSSVRETLTHMQESTAMAGETGETTGNLAREINSIIDGVISITDKINSMATIIQQQTEATGNTIIQVQTVATEAEENARFAQENISKVEDLKSVSQRLNQSVAAFKLKS